MNIKLVVLFFIISIGIKSQNYVIDGNKNSFHLGGQFTSNNGSTIIAVLPGYTFNGKFTLGVTFGHESNDDFDISSNSIKPYISYLFMKQGEKNYPVSVGFNTSYQRNTFSEADGLIASTIGFGLQLHHQINASENIQIIPGAAVGWNKININYDGNNLGEESGLSYGLLGTVKFNWFYIEPSLIFNEDNSVFSLQVGMLFNK